MTKHFCDKCGAEVHGCWWTLPGWEDLCLRCYQSLVPSRTMTGAMSIGPLVPPPPRAD